MKLRQTSLSDASLNAWIPLAPNIRRVDLSFTDIRRLYHATLGCFANLEKLSLTSTSVSPDELVAALSAASRLRTLNIGALGGSHGGRSAYHGAVSTMTFTDNPLRSLTTVLSQNTVIENVSLVGNTKLARDAEVIAEFILLVGRRLKVCKAPDKQDSLSSRYAAEIELVWIAFPSVLGPAASRPGRLRRLRLFATRTLVEQH